MGELVGAGHVTAGVDCGAGSLQAGVDFNRALRRQIHRKLLQPEAFHIGLAAQRHQHTVEFHLHLLTLMHCQHAVFAARAAKLKHLMVKQKADAVGHEMLLHQRRHIIVFPGHDGWRAVHQSDAGPQPGKALRQLAAHRPGAQHQQARRQLAQLPDVVRVQVVEPVQAWNRWNQRTGTGGHYDGAGGDGSAVDLNTPGRGDSCFTAEALHAQ